MAKILKHLVFGQKKNPPAPPRPDYEAKGECSKFEDHHYANIMSFSSAKTSVSFQEKDETKLFVCDDYSEPADLRSELSVFEDKDYDPLYMAPVDQQVPIRYHDHPEEDEEEMYCVPFEESRDVPPMGSPCMNTIGSSVRLDDCSADGLSIGSDGYEEVPDLSHDFHDIPRPDEEGSAGRPNEEYDEPWEWGPGARLSISLQASPASPGDLSIDPIEEPTYSEPVDAASCESLLSDPELCFDGDMTARQRRLYETAFDSRVKRDIDDIDRLMQSPVLQGDLFRPRLKVNGETGPVLRTASRSSFGSTSGSSTSSTPTHQPQIVSKPSPRPRHYPLHFTPTERRKVALIRDHLPRSLSPLSKPIQVIASVEPLPNFNRNSSAGVIGSFDRQLSLNAQWDSPSRCSDKSSSSQESMDQKDDFVVVSNRREEVRVYPLGKSASRDSLPFRDSSSIQPNINLNNQMNDFAKLRTGGGPNNLNKNTQEISSQDNSESSPFSKKKNTVGPLGIKVLPTGNRNFVLKSVNKMSPIEQIPPNNHLLKSQDETSSTNDDMSTKPCNVTANLSSKSESTTKDQSPDKDDRPSDDYDPPWEFQSNVLRISGVNGSKSVPESLFRKFDDLSSSENAAPSADDNIKNGIQSSENEDSVAEPCPPLPKPSKPLGLSARPNLNLNLNLNSDSPRRARQSLTLNFGCAALCAVGEKVDAALTLEKQGWYHGSISRHDAENLLRVLKEGSYLVRNSESSKQDYSLSLKSARGFMHMKIVHTEGRFILGQFSNPFSSIPEMIHHYSINKLPIKGAEHMSLLYPVIDQLL